MRALITNDDGFDSEGLKSLKEFVQSLGLNDVIIVAPKTNKSASSSSITVDKRCRIEQITEDTFAIDGTPTDCVITAFHDPIFTEKGVPEVVFSGVNIGVNIGVDIVYSGTVAAAMRGILYGVPSFALSQFYYPDPFKLRWNIDNKHLREYILAMLRKKHLFKNCLLNINLPRSDIIGIKHVPQYTNISLPTTKESTIRTKLHQEEQERYITIEAKGSPQFCKFLNDGYVTVTPIGCDFTNHTTLKSIDTEFENFHF